MPHKFNADRRAKLPRQKFRVTNRSEYNEGLRRRGDLTVWISEETLGLWSAPRRMTPGGQARYPDLAIELCLTLGVVFKQPLRQAQGLMRSIVRLLGVEIAVPDFSTLSRLSKGLTLSETQNPVMRAPIQLVVDSTGLKIFGEGDWLKEKHKNKAKRRALLSSIASNQLPGNGTARSRTPRSSGIITTIMINCARIPQTSWQPTNFARRLKTLNGLTPYEYICKIWTSEPDRFILNPIHQMPGLNTWIVGLVG